MRRVYILLMSLVVVLVLPVVVTSSLIVSDSAQAQARKKPKTRRAEVLSKSAYRYIDRAQELMRTEDYVNATESLNIILGGEKFKPYEKAVALQLLGQVRAEQGDYPGTIVNFERALSLGALPSQLVNDLTYSLSQLYFIEDNTPRALELLQKWFSTIDGTPSAEAFAFESRIYLAQEDWPRAEQSIRKALSNAKIEPKKEWIRILLAALFQQEKYRAARPVLEGAVSRWPAVKIFWEQLVAVYYDAEDEDLAFTAKQALYIQGFLTSSTELSNMAQLYLYHRIPYKAAKILENGLKNKQIEATGKNYELLATAWQHASEWEKAIPPLIKAAQKSNDGKLFYQLGQTYLRDEKWKKSIEALQQAIEKGGLNDDKKGSSNLLIGIALVNLAAYDDALVAFRRAGEFDEHTKTAYRWVRSIERKLRAQARRAARGNS